MNGHGAVISEIKDRGEDAIEVGEVASFGDRMVLAAETYEADESAAEDDFRRRGPR